jgi:hypothetical protein
MRPITCLICECQLQRYGQMARFPASDPAGRILSVREPAGMTRPMGRPYDTWLRQMDRHFAGGRGWAVWWPGGWPLGDQRSTARR